MPVDADARPQMGSIEEMRQPVMMEEPRQVMNPDSTISLAEVNNEVFDQRAIAQLKRQLSRANADEAQKAHAIQLLATSLRAVQAQAKTAQAENKQLKAIAIRLSQQEKEEKQHHE